MQSLGIVDLWAYLIGVIFIILLPGPNTLYVLAAAAQRGVRAGYQAAAGVFLGDSILMTLSAAGVASLLKANPLLFFALKYGGAAYLFYLGATMLRTAWRTRGNSNPVSVRTVEAQRPFRRALMISLLNPKAILFFISFFIQFVDPAYPYPALSFIVLGAIDLTVSSLYLSLLIFAGVRLAHFFRQRRALAVSTTSGAGALLIGFGLKLATATLS
jgi:leucine efflux protein